MVNRIEAPLTGADPAIAALVRAAATAAVEGGKIIRGLYDKPHQVRFKGEIDLVTEADVAAEKSILSRLRREFPAIPVLSRGGESRLRPGPRRAAMDHRSPGRHHQFRPRFSLFCGLHRLQRGPGQSGRGDLLPHAG